MRLLFIISQVAEDHKKKKASDVDSKESPGQSGRTGTMHLLTGELEVLALDVFL